MIENQSTTEGERIRQLLKQISINSRRSVGLAPTELRDRSIQAAVDWVDSWEADWNVACCWHANNSLRYAQNGYHETWLQNHLAAYFNNVHKVAFKHLPKQQRPQIPRFITHEYSENVGWHAHGILATPKHLTSDEFAEILRGQWMMRMRDERDTAFSKHLFWFMPIGDGYKHYMLKSAVGYVSDIEKKYSGFIDERNTHRP